MKEANYAVRIPLKPQPKPLQLRDNPKFPHCIATEFATRYLEELGASATPDNVSAILECMPEENWYIGGEWRKEGFLEDCVVVRGTRGNSSSKSQVENVDDKPPDSNASVNEKKLRRASAKQSISDMRSMLTNAKTEKDPRMSASMLPPNEKNLDELLSEEEMHKRAQKIQENMLTQVKMSLSFEQKKIVLPQMLLGLLKPFSTTDEEVNVAMEMFVKRFDFDSMLGGVAASGEGRVGMSATSPTSPMSPKSPEKPNNGKERGSPRSRTGSPVPFGATGGVCTSPGRKTTTFPSPVPTAKTANIQFASPAVKEERSLLSLTSSTGSLSMAAKSVRTVDFGSKHLPLKERLVTFLMCPETTRLVDLTCHYLYFAIVQDYALKHPHLIDTIEKAKRTVKTKRNSVVADITEEDNAILKKSTNPGKKAVAIRDLDDQTALLGTVKISDLRLVPLPSKSKDQLALNMVKGFNSVKADAVRRMGKLATKYHLPLFLLALRNAADNLFVRLYRFLSKDVEKYLDDKTGPIFGHDLWRKIHSEITRIFDPHKFFSFLPNTGKLDQDSVMERRKRRENNKVKFSRNVREASTTVIEDMSVNEEVNEEIHVVRDGDINGVRRRHKEVKQHLHEVVHRPRKPKTNFYAVSSALKEIVACPKSAAARGMTGDTEYNTDVLDDKHTTSMGPKSRAKLLESVMMKNSERYSSNYKKTKNRDDHERACLLVAEARPDVVGREIVKRDRMMAKMRKLEASENNGFYARDFRK